MLPDTKWVSEIGLDFGRDTDARDRRNQVTLLERILDHSLTQSKVLSIHSRGAAKSAVEVLKGRKLAAILHWYSGPLGLLEQASEDRLYFSVNPAMLRSEKGLSIVNRIPHDLVLLETDGPFVSLHDRRAEPADLRLAAQDLSRIWGVSLEECELTLTSNLAKLLARVA